MKHPLKSPNKTPKSLILFPWKKCHIIKTVKTDPYKKNEKKSMPATQLKTKEVTQRQLNEVSKKFEYPEYVKWTYRISSFFAFTFLLMGFFICYEAITAGKLENIYVFTLVTLIYTATPLIAIYFGIRPFAISSFEITKKGIFIYRGRKKEFFDFNEMSLIKNKSLLGSTQKWLTLKAKGLKPRSITTLLKDGHIFFEKIQNLRPNLIDDETLLKYKESNIIDSNHFKRPYERLTSWPSFLFSFLIIPAIATTFLFMISNEPLTTVIKVCFVINFFIRFFVGFLNDSHWNLLARKQWKKKPFKLNETLSFEKKHKYIYGGLHLICCLDFLFDRQKVRLLLFGH